jgi:hypothetical protein
MPKLNFTEMIDKAAGLTDEQKKIAREVFGIESLTTAIEEQSLHVANETFRAEKATLQANWDKANSEYLAMQDQVANGDATRVELAQAKKDLAEATEKLKTANPGVDIDKLTADITKVVMDKAGTLELGRGAIELDAIECVAAHRELFGQGISARQLVQDALAAKKPVTAYWEEHYKVADKRTELSKAAHDKEMKDADEAGYKRALAEREHPGTRPLAPSKDPFWVPKPSTTEAMQPWESEGRPAEEEALLGELMQARG